MKVEQHREPRASGVGEGSNALCYGACIAAGATAAIAIAPSLLSVAGCTAGNMAAGSLSSGVRSLLYEGAMAGLCTFAQTAGTTGLGVAGAAAAGTVVAAIGAASNKAAKCFVKEFTASIKKGIAVNNLNRGINKPSKRRQLTSRSTARKSYNQLTEDVIEISSGDDSS